MGRDDFEILWKEDFGRLRIIPRRKRLRWVVFLEVDGAVYGEAIEKDTHEDET